MLRKNFQVHELTRWLFMKSLCMDTYSMDLHQKSWFPQRCHQRAPSQQSAEIHLQDTCWAYFEVFLKLIFAKDLHGLSEGRMLHEILVCRQGVPWAEGPPSSFQPLCLEAARKENLF